MRITRLAVENLFRRFNHEIQFKTGERITMIVGPNGFGKTALLNILNTTFNRPILSLTAYTFDTLEIDFDDKSTLKIRQGNEDSHGLTLEFTDPSGATHTHTPPTDIAPSELTFPVGRIEDILPFLDQVSDRAWRDRRSGERLDLTEVVTTYGDRLPLEFQSNISNPDWLETIRSKLSVHLIDTERLTRRTDSPRLARPRSNARRSKSPQRAILRYSEELADKVQRTLSEYGQKSQSLDRSFPTRVVNQPPSEPSHDDLRRRLQHIEHRREELVSAGLIAKDHAAGSQPPSLDALDQVDKSRLGVLEVYANDAEKKLEVFASLYQRVSTFNRIANSKLLHKSVAVTPDGLRVVSDEGSDLEPDMLSSGEQHELVMLYNLLFHVKPGALIMIDEPELSLHVAWQEKVLEDLQEMAALVDFSVLLATHSPQIIGDRWDLTVELHDKPS